MFNPSSSGMANQESLSLKELKHNLKQVLKSSGVVNDVKASVRSDFIKSLTSSNKIQKQLSYRETLLLSSIFHFLKRKSLMHTLSVFKAECGLEMAVILSEDNIYESLYLTRSENDTSSLESIFDGICTRNRKAFVSTSVQTDHAATNIRTSLNSQVNEIRHRYLLKKEAQDSSPSSSIEEKMIAFERECEMRVRREIESQFTSLHEIEIARVKLEASQQARGELDHLRRELEADYQRRLQTHISREEVSAKGALERERAMHQTQYEYRQRMQREVDELRSREEAMRKKYDLEAQGLTLLELRVKESIAALETREREVYRRERETDLLMKESLERARVEARAHLQDELDAVLRERALVRLERQRVDEEKAHQAALLEELGTCRTELKQFREQCDLKHEEIGSLRQKLNVAETLLIEEKNSIDRRLSSEREGRLKAEQERSALRNELEEMKALGTKSREIANEKAASAKKIIGITVHFSILCSKDYG